MRGLHVRLQLSNNLIQHLLKRRPLAAILKQFKLS